jgi:hypothetical protein
MRAWCPHTRTHTHPRTHRAQFNDAYRSLDKFDTCMVPEHVADNQFTDGARAICGGTSAGVAALPLVCLRVCCVLRVVCVRVRAMCICVCVCQSVSVCVWWARLHEAGYARTRQAPYGVCRMDRMALIRGSYEMIL